MKKNYPGVEIKKISIILCCIIVLVTLALWAPSVLAYKTYKSGESSNCSACHPGFLNGSSGPLHVAHTAYINACTACHQSPGSTPVETANSGLGPGCTGCHNAPGLWLHHTNAGVKSCHICHGNPVPLPESSAPPYYGTFITSIVDPCLSSSPQGEDANDDGFGLDNDGDSSYDENDPDCGEFFCGDGTVDPNGQCDHGKKINDDGCGSDCTITAAFCSDGNQPVITEMEYDRDDEELDIEGRATSFTTISVINSDTGEILADQIRVREEQWEAEIGDVGTSLENISVISSNGCAINQDVETNDEEHY
jgi:cysteine-rich repeat protein